MTHNLSAIDRSLNHWSPVIGPGISLLQGDGRVTLDTPNQRLRFTGASGALVRDVFPLANGAMTLLEIAQKTGYAPRSVFAHFDELSEDDAIGWFGCSLLAETEDAYFQNLRMLARFCNRAIFSEPVAKRLFAGKAHVSEVRLWAQEFFCFIRAANRYMAKGISRLDISAALQEIGIRHYVDEAEHEDIFREGLIGVGLAKDQVDSHVPLPSTQALLNFLFETASEDYASYLALFTVMQPLKVPPTTDDIAAKYDRLSEAYPPVAPFFAACKTHDLIDAGLGHSEWGLQELVRASGLPGYETRQRIEEIMVQTSAFFCLFYRGIGRQPAIRKDRPIRYMVSSSAAFNPQNTSPRLDV